MRKRRTSSGSGKVVVTGGAGFVGTNLVKRLLQDDERVTIFDNLSRPGVERNLEWLMARFGKRLEHELGDIRDPEAVAHALRGATAVYHFAAQVAVTTSIANPIVDFQINAGGTLTLLEAIRKQKSPPVLIFTSTNKVYGALSEVELERDETRYVPVESAIRDRGIGSDHPLDLHSPYGCSKGAADQYVLDYSRVFGLPTLVFRMSCIYGPHQFGTEDQGWVAHFLMRMLQGQPVCIYGDGRQVRDVLFADDLVEALIRARDQVDAIRGHAYNIGGGPQNSISLLELVSLAREAFGPQPQLEFRDWRPGDQRYYVSDTSLFQSVTGWAPRVSVPEGVHRLIEWLGTQESQTDTPVEVAARRIG